MNPLATIVRWLVLSSADPAQVSLTVRGFLIGLIPFLMMLAGFAQINVGSEQLTAIVDATANIVQTVLALVAGVMTAYGLLRKLWITIRTHQEVTSSQE